MDAYVGVAARMADELRNDPAIKGGGIKAARRIAKYLFEENGFHGSRGDEIGNPSNSYLNEVLDDREGIPITLSVVYLELARRLGVKSVHGLSLPGRFMVGCEDRKDGENSLVVIDVFSGGKFLSRDQAASMVFEGTNAGEEDVFFAPATPRAIILRMLNNLAGFAGKPENTLPWLDLYLAVDPQAAAQRLNRALLRLKSGDTEDAKRDLEKLIDERPRELDVDRIERLYQAL